MRFAEGDTVLTRRWTWRQANHTLTVLDTQTIAFNIDALAVIPHDELERICYELEIRIKQFCGGETRHEILTKTHPQLTWNVSLS